MVTQKMEANLMQKMILYLNKIWGNKIMLKLYGGMVFENIAPVSSGKLDACLSKNLNIRKEA